MNTTWFDSGIRQIACTSISGYQKYLSPHKGFSCAHRILYGGESCSAYIKRIVAQKGLKAAFQASRRRFRDCKKANQILRAMVSNSQTGEQDYPKKPQGEEGKPQNQQNICGEMLNTACITFPCGDTSTEISCHLFDCNNCVNFCGSLDCGGCGDFGSGLDCSGLDCGSCGSCGS
ncbi:MAG: membrane protein insertion efficiency factor YidD [Phormidium sp.]